MNKTQDKDYSDEDIIMMIRKDEGGMTRAMEILYGRQDLQRSAYRIFGNYRRTLDLFTWQDVFLESIVRLVTGVLFGSGGKISNLSGYFSGICNNYCKDLLRKGERKLEGGEHGFGSWRTAMAAWRADSDHHSSGAVLESLERAGIGPRSACENRRPLSVRLPATFGGFEPHQRRPKTPPPRRPRANSRVRAQLPVGTFSVAKR